MIGNCLNRCEYDANITARFSVPLIRNLCDGTQIGL